MKYMYLRRICHLFVALFIVFCGMCFGYSRADSVSACIKSADSAAAIGRIYALSHTEEVLGREDTRETGSGIGRDGNRRQETGNVWAKAFGVKMDFPWNQFQTYCKNALTDECFRHYSGQINILYRHLTDGEKKAA